MSKTKFIKYFGYGSNSDLDMMVHMVGRADLKGEKGRLLGYELCIQKIDQIRDIIPHPDILPVSPREIIRKTYGDSFELFVARQKPDTVAYGTIWDLTTLEVELVKNWELVEFGMQEEVNAIAMDSKGNIIQVETQAVINPPPAIDRVVIGDDYPRFIADRKKMLEIADQSRLEYLQMKKNQKGGEI